MKPLFINELEVGKKYILGQDIVHGFIVTEIINLSKVFSTGIKAILDNGRELNIVYSSRDPFLKRDKYYEIQK